MTPGNASFTDVHEQGMHVRRVNLERNDVGSAYDPRESKPAEKLRARDSDHSIQFRLAYWALLLVSRGASERDAVQRAAALDPRSRGVKREALDLVLGTVSEQDVTDILVRNVHPEEKMGMNARCLFRLTAYAMLRFGARGTRRIEHSLRAIAPIDLLPKLELFLGTLPAIDPTQLLSGLRDSERVALETHHPVWWVAYCFHILGRGDAVA